MPKEDDIQQTIKWLKERLTAVESDNEKLKAQVNTKKKMRFQVTRSGSNSDWLDSVQNRNHLAEKEKKVTLLEKEVDFEGRENECPYCNMNKEDSLLDKTRSGKYSCRRCGKTWREHNLNKEYSLEIERDTA